MILILNYESDCWIHSKHFTTFTTLRRDFFSPARTILMCPKLPKALLAVSLLKHTQTVISASNNQNTHAEVTAVFAAI